MTPQALSWLQQLGNPYETVAVDRSGREAIDWGVYGAPETFLVNPQGIVVYKHIGALDRGSLDARDPAAPGRRRSHPSPECDPHGGRSWS